MAFTKALALLAAFAVVAAARNEKVLHEKRSAVPSGFVCEGPAPATHELQLRFGLAPQNAAGLQAKLLELSTPGNANYHQWLSKEEVKTFMGPSEATVQAFNAFAAAHGLNTTGVSPNGDWISATVPVAQANDLFDADYQLFSHAQLESQIARTMSVSLPREIVGVVNVIHPSTTFDQPPSKPASPPFIQANEKVHKSKAHVPASCDTNDPHAIMTPACLQQIYGIPTKRAQAGNNSLLATGYLFQWAQEVDLKLFLEQLRPDIPSTTTFNLQNINGGSNPQGAGWAGEEANLDMQYTVGLATGVPVTFLSVGEFDFLTALLDTTTYLQGVSNPPTVMTTSYGMTESVIDITVVDALCNAYMSLGARGISVLFASGDGGVHNNHDSLDDCDMPDLAPVFPATCPFITSVGGTIGFPETAVNFTGGGFSTMFPAPAYQQKQVASFLKTVPANFSASFNRTGRGYPDVALQAVNFQIGIEGALALSGGTSASSPTFASMIALINDRLIAAGKPVLGFLNPFLYANSGAFNDITVGHNSGSVCPASSVGFDATTGWDPLSGMGTPNFKRLLAAALAA
ncbi:unnamed protein product [Mycena citricolor]|uniref:tripeptidyl-peptidase II n=1 Tax=Mycena citricolor TaxID=2018698 RepID=A0AAD2GUX9_9AGAR|nr:unnamed protein product [Mycena citricolor]CAK5281070.1 unnamed protein product [Mycena citricolor]